jgi:hypothetical protein
MMGAFVKGCDGPERRGAELAILRATKNEASFGTALLNSVDDVVATV